MKTILTILLSLSILSGVLSQIKPLVKKGTTRAILIGISDYKFDKIPDLKYADADVAAFRGFLQRQQGLQDGNIRLLTNERATRAAIMEALYWLVDETSPGDQAIIYFSGHGDKEADIKDLSFLLAYDTPPVNYRPGALDVRILEDFIRKLSVEKQAEVLLITDACRSGNLAGHAVNGAQLTNEALSARAFNEVRLLSCQADEYSVEGIQWGNGRGAFSFHLINGLIGMADSNEDEEVQLLEIRNYLQEVVPKETEYKQYPEVLGDPKKELNRVVPALLADLKASQEGQGDLLAAANDNRGIEKPSPVSSDTSLSGLYKEFQQALADGHLLYPEEGSAYQLYKRLSGEESMKFLDGSMRRSLATAFQEGAQEAINDYIVGNPQELSKRWAYGARYKHHPEYLAKAAELLGENSLHADVLKGDYYYFIGLNKRLEAEEKRMPALFEEALTDQQKALDLEPRAPHVLNEIAVLLLRLDRYEEAKPYLYQANALTPTWSLPLNNLFYAHYRQQAYDSAATYAQRTLAVDPDLVFMDVNLGLLAEAQGDSTKAEQQYRKAIERQPDYGYAYLLLGWLLWERGRLEEAEQAINICILLEPENPQAINRLGLIKRDQGEFAAAAEAFQRAIDINPEWPSAYLNMARMQVSNLKQYTQAEPYLLRYLELRPQQEEASLYLVIVKTAQGVLEEAVSRLKKAAEKGISASNWRWLQTDEQLEPLRNTPEFKELLQTYQPRE